MAEEDGAIAHGRLTFTIAELVRVTPGLSRTRVYEALKNHEIRAKKLGKRTIIPREEVTRFLDSLPDYSAAA